MWDKVWGWRGRVGLIMPASQQATEPAFYAVAPEGISFHTARLQIFGAGTKSVADTEKFVPQAIEELAQARVNCIAYMCVTGGLLRGQKGEEQFCADVEKKTGIPMVSALLSVLEAFGILGVRKVVVADPYVDDIDELERKFLKSAGFEVVANHNLRINDAFEMSQVLPKDIYTLSEKIWNRSADGLYLGCCAFNTLPAMQAIEDDLKKPVVSAHSAVLWKVLKILGIKEPLSGYGKLLREYL